MLLPNIWVRIPWEKWIFTPNLKNMQQNAHVLKLFSKMLIF